MSEGSNQVAVRNQWTPKQVIRHQLDQSAEQFSNALAGRIDKAEFARICMTTFSKGGERMANVTPESFLAACMEAAQLGLRPEGTLGEAYIIPRKDRKTGRTLANFQIGYQGVLKLAMRAGVVKIEARVAFEDEEFEVVYGTQPGINHRPNLHAPLKGRQILAAYAVATLKGGETQFEVVDRDELDRTAEKSGHPGNRTPSDVWRDHPVAMAKKTAILRLCKFLPNPDHHAKRALQDADKALHTSEAITVEQIDTKGATLADV